MPSNTAARPRDAGPALDAPPPPGAATLTGALAAWADSLGAHLAAIRAYMREAGDAGGRALGQRWSATAAAVDAAGRALEAFPGAALAAGDDVSPGAALAALMAASDAAEGVSRALDAAAGAALDPNVQAAALAGMSRTFSENLKGLGRRVLEAGLAAKARYREASGAASAAGAAAGSHLELAAIAAAYDGRPDRGGVATELYVSALLCRASREGREGPAGRADPEAALRRLEAAKDAAFGLAADTEAAAAADGAALAEYHPLQAMAYAPAAFGPPRKLKGAATDLSLPQARLAVLYDLAPLVDRRRALAHGPVASTTTGLNFRLVERLRTIRAENRAGGGPAPKTARAERDAAPRAGPLTVTTDGETARDFDPSAGRAGELWAPFASSHPRVEAHSAASAAIILAAILEGRADGWNLDLRVRYEDAVRGELLPSSEPAEEALLSALVAEFEKAYDASPPESPHDFRDLVVPEKPAPGDYLCAAAARLGFGALDARLRALHARPAAVRVPHAVVVREARITQAIQAVDAGRKLWSRIRDAYRPDAEAFSQPASQIKAVLMTAFRRIALAAVREGPVDCMAPTLKGFAATAPRLVA